MRCRCRHHRQPAGITLHKYLATGSHLRLDHAGGGPGLERRFRPDPSVDAWTIHHAITQGMTSACTQERSVEFRTPPRATPSASPHSFPPKNLLARALANRCRQAGSPIATLPRTCPRRPPESPATKIMTKSPKKKQRRPFFFARSRIPFFSQSFF